MFTALHPLALVLSLLYVQFYGKQQTHDRDGHERVALRGEDEALHHGDSGRHGQQNGELQEGSETLDSTRSECAQRRTAREVDVEALWR
jgi:hypothetical protein